jgi:hypothetical protein
MPFSINIDETRSPPPVKKAPERGPLTFIVGIEQGVGPAKFIERRNLSRGNNLLTEPPKPLDPVFKALDNIHISFTLSSLINNQIAYNPPPLPETDEPYVDPDAVSFSLAKNYQLNINIPLPLEDTMVTTPDDLTVVG